MGKILPYDEHIRYTLVSLSHLRWQHLRYVYIGGTGHSLSLGLLAQIRHVGMEPLNKDLECSMIQSGWETHTGFPTEGTANLFSTTGKRSLPVRGKVQLAVLFLMESHRRMHRCTCRITSLQVYIQY